MTGDQDFDGLLRKCVDILRVKGDDYQAGSPDRLANFKEVARFVGITPGQVLATYLYKHIASLFRYIQVGGQTESEPIEGRLADIINYCLLFQKMTREGSVGVPGQAWAGVTSGEDDEALPNRVNAEIKAAREDKKTPEELAEALKKVSSLIHNADEFPLRTQEFWTGVMLAESEGD